LILAALSDYFDGYYARKYKVISNFGKILDPIADKLLVIGILFALALDHMLSYHLAFIPALIIILREIFISGLRENMAQYKFSIIVSILAKWKTTVQLFACGSFLVWRSDPFIFQIQIIGWISQILLWVAAIFTIITGIEYILKTVSFFKEQDK
jgi:cardiolipin synthase